MPHEPESLLLTLTLPRTVTSEQAAARYFAPMRCNVKQLFFKGEFCRKLTCVKRRELFRAARQPPCFVDEREHRACELRRSRSVTNVDSQWTCAVASIDRPSNRRSRIVAAPMCATHPSDITGTGYYLR
jgi:hypothetical protein